MDSKTLFNNPYYVQPNYMQLVDNQKKELRRANLNDINFEMKKVTNKPEVEIKIPKKDVTSETLNLAFKVGFYMHNESMRSEIKMCLHKLVPNTLYVCCHDRSFSIKINLNSCHYHQRDVHWKNSRNVEY